MVKGQTAWSKKCNTVYTYISLFSYIRPVYFRNVCFQGGFQVLIFSKYMQLFWWRSLSCSLIALQHNIKIQATFHCIKVPNLISCCFRGIGDFKVITKCYFVLSTTSSVLFICITVVTNICYATRLRINSFDLITVFM